MIHASIVWCNGAMNAYTTNDAFLRDNIGWVSLSTNWNRFSATSSLGLIHTGNKEGAMEVLRPYLRAAGPDGQPTSPYSQGGAYYAYGLIHANKFTPETSAFLTQEF
jgi:26S proteasome regulatory subunit N2